jgi:hypothetical protein
VPLFDLSQSLEVVHPLPPQELAALTARRVATNGISTNLLPSEFAARYKQKFVDRIWMRALGAIAVLYMACALVYIGFVKYADYRHGQIQGQIASLGQTYTNTIRLREELKVLQDTIELQYAALECYLSVAKTLPSELTLNNINFERGRKVTFFGTASAEDRAKVLDFNAELLKYVAKDQPLFSKVNSPNMGVGQPGQPFTWNFSADLKRTDSAE